MVVLRLSKALAEGEPRLPAVSRVRATARPLEERSGLVGANVWPRPVPLQPDPAHHGGSGAAQPAARQCGGATEAQFGL